MARMKQTPIAARNDHSASVSFNERLQHDKDDFVRETGLELYTTLDLAKWAIATGRWEPPRDLAIRKCREDYAKAMRAEYIRGSDGKPVRVNQAARTRSGMTQTTFWGDIRTVNRDHFDMARVQRREQIVGECRQLDRDERFYSGLHPDEAAFETLFDIRDDVIEGRYSGKMDEKDSGD